MGKRKISSSNDAVKSAKSKARKLLENPINIEMDEFDDTRAVEEMTHCKFIISKDDGLPVLQDWSKGVGKVSPNHK